MSNRIFAILGLFAALVLGAAAVWLGGLNQDEGWYLYAANLVAEGKVPYADFAFTQGPVMPVVYSVFAGIWKSWGILGARIFTLALGFAGILFAALTARRLADADYSPLVVFLLLGSNLYHLYYLAIPKTYALATLFVTAGFYLLTFVGDRRASVRIASAALSGASFALAAGTRISLGAILAVVGAGLIVRFCIARRRGGAVDADCSPRQDGDAAHTFDFLWFALGGGAVLAIVYGGLLLSPATREGLIAAQKYHAARGGFDPVFAVGSLSRLVRWYLPVFVLLGLGVVRRFSVDADYSPRQDEDAAGSASTRTVVRVYGCGRDAAPTVASLVLVSFLAVFAVQMLAPFPYEDYQVPVMALLAIYTAVLLAKGWRRGARDAGGDGGRETRGPLTLLLALGLAWASSFGSPLLEKWMTNGQDRFWSLKKPQPELAQLRDVARRIEALDPDGKDILTQDLYLAIELDRKVPHGLEMGPFSALSDAGWRNLLESAPCRVAALSGYSFAVNPPVCDERPLEDQLDYWNILKSRYELAFEEDAFGQNATTLLVLKRKGEGQGSRLTPLASRPSLAPTPAPL